jgi:hypothetical protein
MPLFRLLLIFAMAFYLPPATAGQYDWVIEKLPKNFEDVDKSSFAVGIIGTQEYLAMNLNVGTEAEKGFKPAMVFTRIGKDKAYDPFAVIPLPSLQGLRFQIKNESIYIRLDSAHHGVYFTTYQFKRQNDDFRLVGIEAQSITPSNYAGIKGNIELWEGRSLNLLTSEAILWAEAFNLDKLDEWKQWEKALKRHDQGLPSTKAKTRKVSLKLNGSWRLEHFDPYDFRGDFLCHYFDHNLKFHSSCK